MKPSLKRFKEVAQRCNGNISAIASFFSVYRSTVYKWMTDDSDFREAVNEHRGRLFDKCLKTAELLANGVPLVETTETGQQQFAGWKVQPDSGMLRYLLGSLGRAEGFGEHIDITSNGETIKDEKPEPYVIRIIDDRTQVAPIDKMPECTEIHDFETGESVKKSECSPEEWEELLHRKGNAVSYYNTKHGKSHKKPGPDEI